MKHLPLKQRGDIVGPYRVVRLLGAGFEGDVFLATHVRTGTYRSLKVLRGRDMLREAEHTAFHYRRLRSVSAIKRFHEWGVVEGQGSVGTRPWLAFDFIRGETLAARVAKGPFKSPLSMLVALSQALIPLHRKGYGVCDMDRARNVLVERGTGSIKFCDMDVGVAGGAPPPVELDFDELAVCARLLYGGGKRVVPGPVREAFAGVTSMVELAGRLRWTSLTIRRGRAETPWRLARPIIESE